MIRVAVLDDWQSVAADCVDWSSLRARAEVHFFNRSFTNQHDLIDALAPFDIILPMRERTFFPASVLEALPRLKFIAVTGRPTRHIDMEVCNRRGILCSWSGTYHPEVTAEYTLGLILAAERDIVKGAVRMQSGGFQEGTGLGRTLRGLTLGLVGLGNIGSLVARYAAALGMRTLAWSRSLTPELAATHQAIAVPLDQLLAQSDIVSLHVPLTPDSRKLVGARELGLMKTGALLVNTSRGSLLDEDALLAELESGRIRAVLDVFAVEPLPANHRLRDLPNALLCPHLGFSTRDCFAGFYADCIENICAYLDDRPIRLLNEQALTVPR